MTPVRCRIAHRREVTWAGMLVVARERLHCRIVDISRFGAKLKLAARPLKGEIVTVSCENFVVDGEIVWQTADFVGVRFDHFSARSQAFLAKLSAQNPSPNFGRRGGVFDVHYVNGDKN